jgi:indolepyruvate ferredoxin oxidoreductase alpha subunit
LEELEPYLEREVLVLASMMNKPVKVFGKLDGTYKRSGEYNAAVASAGFFAYKNLPVPEHFPAGDPLPAAMSAARPITCCAGCPHRGTYLSVIRAIKAEGYKKDEVLVTGDVGCTILGMNPPFDLLWTETAMGSSIPTAAGYKLSGLATPVIATIGDSTFFHAGIPPLINAIQHGIDMTVIVMDNGWTAMTGMQVNPGTDEAMAKKNHKRVDLYFLLQGLGIDNLYVTDPYDVDAMTDVIRKAMNQKGVKVVLARRECAIRAGRSGIRYGLVGIDPEKCTKCKNCIRITGCPALTAASGSVTIDQKQCNGCSVCVGACPIGAIERKEK